MPDIYRQVKDYILQRISIPDDDLQQSFQFVHLREYKKGESILRMGDYCRFIGFINEGLVMGTIIDAGGKQIACSFTFENCFFTYTEGISSHVPSHKNFVALEDCEMLMLDKEKLPHIFSLNQKFETLFTQILAEELRNLLLADHRNRTLSAADRYLQFNERCPQAFNRIPLKYIAGYLGIEPESLSRLRKKIAGK
jgi:CRP/FNR family transcriptional regulator, anaerobic regulatory protein